jgi:hypothetical protein
MESDIDVATDHVGNRLGLVLNIGLTLIGAGTLAWLAARFLRAYYYGFFGIWALVAAAGMILLLMLWLDLCWPKRSQVAVGMLLLGVAVTRMIIHGPL